MTPQQQRIALAEWEGWTKIDAVPSRPWGFPPEGHPHIFSPLPDYLSDLNAVHELEERLTHDQWRIYLGFVMGARIIPKLASMEEFHRAWNTTAAQRCEALLRTLGLWKD